MTDLKALQEEIAIKTINTASLLIRMIDTYMGDFNKSDLLTFKRGKEQNERFSTQYYFFVSSISPIISELTSLNARLASLLIAADKAMDVELVVACEKRFNAFEAFERDLYEYTSSVEAQLSNSSASATFLLKAAQKFKTASERLLDENR